MPALTSTSTRTDGKSRLERALSLFTDIRAGEGATAALMLVNIFLLLICYSVIKTVREPLILLGGGAEVRSYAAAGQALLLVGFVPLYSWVASRVDRLKLIVGVTLFFVACIELFAAGVAVGVPYIGVAFFVWVGIFNISLVAQFWSFANDIYVKDAGARLFPIIMVGMTAGAPLGSLVAARLFRLGLTPQVILQVSALLLAASVLLYLVINRRETRHSTARTPPLSARGGFGLVLRSRYLRLVALLVVLLNVVNTTGEYMVARLLTAHVGELAASDAAFDRQAYIGAFSGDYQFWVNVTALLLQAFVTSRLVKHTGLRGALLALPLIALGGYSLIAAGVGFSVVRWIKTAENATDYSVMNTARQLLWLPTSREEKYKAKQAIDTFYVRAGDVLSACAVYVGTAILHLSPNQFAVGNVVLTMVWLGVAVLILRPARTYPRLARHPLAGAAAVAGLLVVAAPAQAQETREALLADQRAAKATRLRPYAPDALERRIELVDDMLLTRRTIYPVIGSVFEGGGLSVGPGYRRRLAELGWFDARAAWSLRGYGAANANVILPEIVDGRVRVEAHAERLHAPTVPFYGLGNGSRRSDRVEFAYDATTVGAAARFTPAAGFAVGAAFDWIENTAGGGPAAGSLPAIDLAYRRTGAFAEIDWRTSPGYTRRGGFYRLDWSDYRESRGGSHAFRRLDAEVQQFVPLLRERWVIALRALATTTDTDGNEAVPYFMLPALGGSHALRGYAPWRFRDRNRLLFTGEYRWTAGALVDMALFVDAGKVAARRSDLSLQDLRTSHGLGVTFHTPSATVARVQLARSREGTSLLLSFGQGF